MNVVSISPADFLQFGALGALTLFMVLNYLANRAMAKEWRTMMTNMSQERTAREDIMVRVIQDNSTILAQVNAAVNSMQSIVLSCVKAGQHLNGNDDV